MTNLESSLIGYSLVATLYSLFEGYYNRKLTQAIKDWRNYAVKITNEASSNEGYLSLSFVKDAQQEFKIRND